LGDRYANEVLANDKLFQSDPGIFDKAPEKVLRDLILFSLTAYLQTKQHDWKTEEQHLKTSSGSMITNVLPKSNPASPSECTKISVDEIRRKLRIAGNLFAGADVVGGFAAAGYVCLPPSSWIDIGETSLILTNPFCMISFSIEHWVERIGTRPGAQTADLLPNGDPRFDTWVTPIQVTIENSRIRAQHRDFPEYEQWAKNMVDGAKAWFETKKEETPPPWFGDDGEGEGALFWTGTDGLASSIQIQGGKIHRQVP
jgi:hypothetical protein